MENQIFNIERLQELILLHKYNEANAYISSFFFKSGISRFFRNGAKNEFDKYDIADAIKLIPDDLTTYVQ